MFGRIAVFVVLVTHKRNAFAPPPRQIHRVDSRTPPNNKPPNLYNAYSETQVVL